MKEKFTTMTPSVSRGMRKILRKLRWRLFLKKLFSRKSKKPLDINREFL
jgi:hypothetical protein